MPPMVRPSPGGSEKRQSNDNVLLLPLVLIALALVSLVILAIVCVTVRRRRRRKLSADGVIHLNPTFENNLYGDDPQNLRERDQHRGDSPDLLPPLHPCPPPPYPGTPTMERQSSAYLEPVSGQGAASFQVGAEPDYGGYKTLDSFVGYIRIGPRTEKQRRADCCTEYDQLTPRTAKRNLSTKNCGETADTAIGPHPDGSAVAACEGNVYETLDQPSDHARQIPPTEERPVGVTNSKMCAENEANEAIYEDLDKVAD